MRTTRNYRPPFLTAAAARRDEGRRQAYADISCDFVVVRSVTVGGVSLVAGEPFDKALVDERRLGQLYSGRTIALAPGSRPVTPPPRPLAVGPTDLLHPGVATAPAKKSRPRAVARVRRAA